MVNQKGRWVPFHFSIAFLFSHARILGWSVLLVAVTALLTWAGYFEAIQVIDHLTGNYFQIAPSGAGVLGWLALKGWVVLKYLFLLVSRIAAFYISFLIAYCLTTPGYVFLSGAVEHIYSGQKNRQYARLSLLSVIVDLWEGLKIGIVGVLVTFIVLAVNFIPVIGQVLGLLIYIFYSTLMFIDYPASNRHWRLGQKIYWVRAHYRHAFRIGFFPALVSLIPVLNILLMALLFPIFTVHTTLNFISKNNLYSNKNG